MLPLVPADAKRVLDVGCGAGAFSAGLKEARAALNQSVEIVGLEMDPEAAALAGEVLDEVRVGDATVLAADLPPGHFDCIMLNDVLEHVLEPEALLRALRPALAPGGCVAASIPNVRYFWNVMDLAVHGRWDYADEGILDRTHFRFFTRSSMARLFRETGFTVETMTGINATGSLKFKLVNLLTLGRWSDMQFLQFAVRATGGTT